MVLSGAAFGVAWGSLVALVGSIAGEWIGFELVRRYGRGVSRGFVGADEFERFSVFFERHGTLAVMLTRPLPVVMETMSLVAGLSTMSRAAFLGASLAGTAPIVVIYAYAGAVSRAGGQHRAGGRDPRRGRRLRLRLVSGEVRCDRYSGRDAH